VSLTHDAAQPQPTRREKNAVASRSLEALRGFWCNTGGLYSTPTGQQTSRRGTTTLLARWVGAKYGQWVRISRSGVDLVRIALVASAALVSACAGGGNKNDGSDHPVMDLVPRPSPSTEDPSLAKRKYGAPEKAEMPRWAPASPTWAFPLLTDHGVRVDDGGQGNFLAPRSHGKHNGIDMLAEVGTPVIAMCNGKAKSDDRGGYGRIVQLVCPVPGSISGGDADLHVSIFYAHLSKTSIPKAWSRVKSGQALGLVGKTGNASSPRISAHLHIEMIVRASEDEALEETHSGVNPKAGAAANAFFDSLREGCLEPAHLTTQTDVRRERRVDPFLMMVCAGRAKPDITAAPGKLQGAQAKWSKFYKSPAFDVDRGPKPLAKSAEGDD